MLCLLTLCSQLSRSADTVAVWLWTVCPDLFCQVWRSFMVLKKELLDSLLPSGPAVGREYG